MKRSFRFVLIASLLTVLIYGCTPAPRFRDNPAGGYNKTHRAEKRSVGKFRVGQTFTGSASWYGPNFHGMKTANGETFDMNDLTAAHKKLPFNTVIEVTYLKSGKSCRVRINDRGPFKGNRILDLSREAAKKIGLFNDGVGKVRIRIVSLGDG